MSYQRNDTLDVTVKALGPDARVLDVGGWYAPYPLATHVVDIMPYETRGAGHSAAVRATERFTKESWVQADVTHPDFRLPYDDNHFAFSICMNTIEDLHEFRALTREMSRVSRRGFIETPSRIVEQTVGVSDRTSSRIGFNHHKWIVDYDGHQITFHDKHESFYQPRKFYEVPLAYMEARSDIPRQHRIFWSGEIRYELRQDFEMSRRLAREYKEGLGVSTWDTLKDKALRTARTVRRIARKQSGFPT